MRSTDNLITPLAAVRDEDLRGAVESAPARALLGEILASPPHRVRPRRRLLLPTAAVAVAAAVTGVALLLGGGSATFRKARRRGCGCTESRGACSRTSVGPSGAASGSPVGFETSRG